MALLAASVVAPNLAHARREPPPAVIPTAETEQAEQLFKAGRYPDAVAAAKAALTKNERYTPAMLVMAKSFYKLHKYEWMKKLWEMMQANGASNAEKAEIYQLLAFLEVDQKNVPGAIVLFKQATEAKRRWKDTLARASQLGVTNDYVKKARENLSKYLPDEFPFIKDERIGLEYP